MKISAKLGAIGILAVFGAGIAIAQENVDPAVKARKALMQLYAYNLGQLGAMAKEEAPYDAEAAGNAAANLAALSMLDQSTMWPAGTDSDSMEGSRALPDIWNNIDDVIMKSVALNEAAVAMEAAAGTDLASLQGAIGPVGQACGACHKAYRQPNDQ